MKKRLALVTLAVTVACGALLGVREAEAQMFSGFGHSIVSVSLEQDGTLVVTHRETSPTLTLQYCPEGCPPPPPHWWREVYGAKDGRIVLLKTVEAEVTPASAAKVEWPD